MLECKVLITAEARASRWITVRAETEEEAIDLAIDRAWEEEHYFDWDMSEANNDGIKVREVTEAELALVEREKALAAGQLDMFIHVAAQ